MVFYTVPPRKLLAGMVWIILLLQVSTTAFAQKVTINERNKPLTDIFKEIRKQSGLDFVYNVKAVKKIGNVSVSLTNADVSSVLSACLSGSNLSFEINNKGIIIKEAVKKPEEKPKEAPPVNIKGKVTDSKGAPLAGATVRTRNSNRTTLTNDNGEFELLNVDEKDVVIISYTGYVTKELAASSASFAVSLNELMQNMSEVVIVGYGTTKKVNLTGAISQVGGEAINQRPTSNVVNSLQGLLPGLNIQSNNGNPGETPEINVRGFNSLNGGSPLILIDGIEGSIDRLNPMDVENVTVLKDAASAAIYGARGAFGVILITTKKGKEGKVQINYTNNFGMARPTNRTDFISNPYEYGKTVDAALYGYNGTTYTGYNDADYEKLQQVLAGEREPFRELQPNGSYKFFYNTNWYDYLFRKWQYSSSHNLSLSGGNEKLQGYLSARKYETQSIQNVNDADLKKYNIKGNLKFKVNNWIEISNNTQLSSDDQLEFAGAKSGYGGLWSNTTWYFLFPFYPTEIDGTPFDFFANGAQAALRDKSNYIKTHREQLVNTISGKITPFKDLQINIDYSNTINHLARTTRLNQFSFLGGDKVQLQTGGVNRLTEERDRSNYNALNIYGTYTKSLQQKHNFKLLVGFNQEEANSDQVTAEQGGLLANNLSSLNLGTEILRATGEGYTWGVQGYFGRFNYDYKNRYLLEVNARYDGSSRFPANSRWGFFPSVSAGWYVSREKFFEPVKDVMSSFKLRASYGKLGNQNIAYNTFLQLLATGQTSWLINNAKANYVGAPPPLPKVVSWENTRTANFGADLGFFNDRFTASFDYFEKNVEDMYLPGEKLPSVFGAAEPKENIGSLRNRGFELSLGYNNSFLVMGSPLRFRATASVYNFVGVITKYPNPNGLMTTYWEGQKLGTIYGYKTDGQFKTDKEALEYENSFNAGGRAPGVNLGQVYNYELNIVQNTEWKHLRAGDLKYLDVNEDGAINKGKSTLEDHGDWAAIGNAMPQYPFGFTINADWKNIDLSIAGAGVTKQDWYPSGDIYWGTYERPYLSFIRKDLVANAWTPEKPGRYPQIQRGYAALNTSGLRSLGETNDNYLTNVGYLRVKNLTIGYTLPDRLTKRAQIQKLRVYISGENILTWSFGGLTRYLDPEMAGAGVNYSSPGSAVVRGRAEDYPIGKIFSAGINLTL
ncbi:TonB-dependent receptor [Niastella sp. OAS944]|uniref:TonB-dependent receptor n=1 Tax=Niastella sp. OAS944 TaxID=2664089 RepID=UPI00348CF2D8|nr:TonB-linked SusC/RagA family outer membrane protein [Chitinophagaceae bacterium OAS944]